MTMPAARLAGGVNEVDDLVFAVALMELDRKPELSPHPPAVGFDLGERLAAVDLGLALAEQIEIGSVQDDDDRAHGASPHGAEGAASLASLSRAGGPRMGLIGYAPRPHHRPSDGPPPPILGGG